MNRKIVMSGISIVASLAMLGGSAFAAFTTQAIASGNTFSSGTDSLLVSPDNVDVDFKPSIISPFAGVNFTPGTTKTYNFFLKNDNTNSTDDLVVSASFANGTGDTVLEDALNTQFSCTDNGVTTTPSAFSVTSMLAGSVNLGTIKSGDTATCTLTVSLPSNVDNTVAGKTTTFDVDFNATGSIAPTPTP